MNKVDNIKVKALIHRVGLKHGLTDDAIKQIVNSPYKFAKEKIEQTDFNSIESEERLYDTKTNFMFRGFGKLVTPFPVIKARNKRRVNRKSLNK